MTKRAGLWQYVQPYKCVGQLMAQKHEYFGIICTKETLEEMKADNVAESIARG